MVRTIIILIITLIVVPVFTFFSDTPLEPAHRAILLNSVWIMLGVALTCFAVSEITRNCSQVDKIWSVVPIVYSWYITWAGDFNERMVLMSVLVTLWGARLTYNFSRRGAYRLKFWEGEEDYRWEELRQNPALNTRSKWFFFNLFFISLYQNALILAFTLPVLVALQGEATPLYWADYLLTAVFIGLVVLETVADQQQWNFQTEKHRRINAGEKLDGAYAGGFVQTGLWARMRHPNYFAEQSIWIVFYLFGVAATGKWLNWSIAGCMLLLILFKGSSDFSEAISARKYPGYKEYQKRVPRFIPKFR